MTAAGVKPMSVAVVGAGISGLACAGVLRQAGVAVTVFDKGRRPGGRVSTRRHLGRQFDHGAQSFTARDPSFAAQVDVWCRAGVVAPWAFDRRTLGGGGPTRTAALDQPSRYIGNGDADAVPRHMALGLDVRTGVEVAPLLPDEGLPLSTTDGSPLGVFEAVVVTAPCAQAARLLQRFPTLAAQLESVPYAACWALMVEFEQPPAFPPVFDVPGVVSFAACESNKPGRLPGQRWIVHACQQWTAAHLEAGPERVTELLLARLSLLGSALPRVTLALAHRWRYARVTQTVGTGFLCDPHRRIWVAGDGLLGPRVEAAWQSGVAAARELLNTEH